MLFRVIDLLTGKEADMREIAREEDWADNLIYCDMEGFAITQEGELYLLDECGGSAPAPRGRFRVEFALE